MEGPAALATWMVTSRSIGRGPVRSTLMMTFPIWLEVRRPPFHPRRCHWIAIPGNRRGRPQSPQGFQEVSDRLRTPVDADLHRRQDSAADPGANLGVELTRRG